MPYTPPNVFVTNTAVDADDLEQNFQELRDYINNEIVQADVELASVDTTDIVRGEYSGVVRDHQFTSGDVFTNFVDVNAFQGDYFTSTWKMYDQFAAKMQHIPQMGKRIVMEYAGTIFFTVGGSFIGDPNYELKQEKRQNTIFVQVSFNDRVLSTDYKPSTKGKAFTEDDVSADVDNSGNTTTDGSLSRRWYCQRYYVDASEGDVVNICLVFNPRSDKSHVTARNLQIEVFYR